MSAMELRQGLRPGDIGAITALHGRVYAAEHGLDQRFESMVAAGLAEHVQRGFPGPAEGLWVAHGGGAMAGSIVLTDEGHGLGRVRWFVLDPTARGRGVGRMLRDALLSHARARGYARLELETFSALRAAAHLYRSAGFTVVSTRTLALWGPTIEMQRYALDL
jgi:ribosomal protein S18 acetylase RimI-like enzyme